MPDTHVTAPAPVRARLEAPPRLPEPRTPLSGLHLPQITTAPRRRGRGWMLFVAMVVLPTLAGIYYFHHVAAPQFGTTAIFALRVGEERDGGAASRGGSLVGAFGPPAGGAAVTQSYGLVRYIASAPAIEDVARTGVDVRDILSSERADPWARLSPGASPEELLRSWRSMVRADYEVTSGVVTLRTFAFTPEESLRLAEGAIAASEGMVNEISARAHADAMRYAEGEVQSAERQTAAVRARLQAHRTSTGVMDPSRTTASNVELEGRLRQDLLLAESQAESIRASGGQGSPGFAAASSRARALRQQLTEMERQVSRNALNREGQDWAQVIDRTEALTAELRLAESRQTQAVEILQQARTNAVRQGTYVLPFVRPVAAVEAAYPNLLLSPLLVAGCALLAWVVTVLLYHALRDHA